MHQCVLERCRTRTTNFLQSADTLPTRTYAEVLLLPRTDEKVGSYHDDLLEFLEVELPFSTDGYHLCQSRQGDLFVSIRTQIAVQSYKLLTHVFKFLW